MNKHKNFLLIAHDKLIFFSLFNLNRLNQMAQQQEKKSLEPYWSSI